METSNVKVTFKKKPEAIIFVEKLRDTINITANRNENIIYIPIEENIGEFYEGFELGDFIDFTDSVVSDFKELYELGYKPKVFKELYLSNGKKYETV